MMEEPVKVSSYTRKRPTQSKPDPEDGTGVELPHVAPKESESIVTVPKAGEPRKPSGSGVTIMGGSSHGQRKAPEIKHGKHA
jgi:hypothetical protein